MSKREYLLRFLAIIKKLRHIRYATFEEINDYLRTESEFTGFRLQVSKRTFQRDLQEIRSLFQLDIQNRKADNVYFIAEEAQDVHSQGLLEAFDMLHLYAAARQNTEQVFFEKRRPKGTEHILTLLQGIRSKRVIHFQYHKFGEEEPSIRQVEAIGIKEFKSRWYLIGYDRKDGFLKSFGMDRIAYLRVSKQSFTKQEMVNAEAYFKDCFGIMNPLDEDEPQLIELSFTPQSARFVKSLPLHPSQQIVFENAKECRITLFVYVTEDLVMELLSHGEKVLVLGPETLQKEVMRRSKASCERYFKSLK